MGGDIALRLAALHPERLWTLTLGGVGGEPLGGWKVEDYDLRALAESLARGEGVKWLFQGETTIGALPLPEEEVARLNDLIMQDNDPMALEAVIRTYGALSVSKEMLRHNQVPAMVIVGELDPERVEAERMLVAEMANLKSVTISGADHVTAASHPKFVDSVLAFLARHAVDSP